MWIILAAICSWHAFVAWLEQFFLSAAMKLYLYYSLWRPYLEVPQAEVPQDAIEAQELPRESL